MIQSNIVRVWYDGALWRAVIGRDGPIAMGVGMYPELALTNLAEQMRRINFRCDSSVREDPLAASSSPVTPETVKERLDRVGYAQVDEDTLRPKG